MAAHNLLAQSASPEIPAQSARPIVPHFPALDGLRGIAILVVMINHYGPLVFTGPQWWQIGLASTARRGYLGVDLFFVLSGFLITGILLDSRGSSNYLARFYWRRSLRIFPLYYFYLAVVWFLIRPFHPYHLQGVDLWWYVSYLSNWNLGRDMLNPLFAHLWSLSVEEQFYVVWPFVVLSFPAARLIWVSAIIALSALLFRFWAVGHMESIQIYILTPARMDTLALGAIMAIVIRNRSLSAWVDRIKWPVVLACAACWLFTLETGAEQTLGYSGAAVFFAIVVFWAAYSCPQLLTVAPLKLLGKYSYGLYMYHVLLRGTMFRYALSYFPGSAYKVVFPIATFLATVLLTLVSWHLLESPLLRLKDRYFGRARAS